MSPFRIRWSRWDRALAILAAAYLVLWPIEGAVSAVYYIRSLLQAVIVVLAAGALIRLGYRGVRMLTRRFLWRVRHRMAVAYLLVGVAPLTLALLMGALVTLLVAGPLAAYFVEAEIHKRAAELYARADSFAWEIAAAESGDRFSIGQRFLQDAQSRYPGLIARFETPDGPVSSPPDFSADTPPEGLFDYRGVVRRQGELYLGAYAQYEPGAPSLLLMVPLTRAYLLGMTPGLGVVERSSDLVERTAAGEIDPSLAARMPAPAHPFDWPVRWQVQTDVFEWEEAAALTERILVFRTRPSAVMRLILDAQSEQTRRAVGWLAWGLLGTFLTLLVVSTAVAVSLTRTITGAISELYAATRRVDQGDFSYRAPVRGYTQLTELARSFNSMTESIERLISDQKEKQRLESEIGIAREVQQQLFPREAPRLDTLEISGVCLAARSVSGDFYDYVPFGHGRMAVSFGDVAGKGISAALVMAAVHSSVRTQLAVAGPDLRDADIAEATARIVAETNRQLCEGTASNQFATLFFAIYDESASRLAYTNAGHLPPFLVRNGGPERLDVNGMVVGAFPHAQYQPSVLTLEPGDLIAAFTDGVSEPENPYGEQFGEDRLAEVLVREADRPLSEIVRAVLDEVRDWTGGRVELFDDMTLLAARRTEAG